MKHRMKHARRPGSVEISARAQRGETSCGSGCLGPEKATWVPTWFGLTSFPPQGSILPLLQSLVSQVFATEWEEDDVAMTSPAVEKLPHSGPSPHGLNFRLQKEPFQMLLRRVGNGSAAARIGIIYVVGFIRFCNHDSIYSITGSFTHQTFVMCQP